MSTGNQVHIERDVAGRTTKPVEPSDAAPPVGCFPGLSCFSLRREKPAAPKAAPTKPVKTPSTTSGDQDTSSVWFSSQSFKSFGTDILSSARSKSQKNVTNPDVTARNPADPNIVVLQSRESTDRPPASRSAKKLDAPKNQQSTFTSALRKHEEAKKKEHAETTAAAAAKDAAKKKEIKPKVEEPAKKSEIKPKVEAPAKKVEIPPKPKATSPTWKEEITPASKKSEITPAAKKSESTSKIEATTPKKPVLQRKKSVAAQIKTKFQEITAVQSSSKSAAIKAEAKATTAPASKEAKLTPAGAKKDKPTDAKKDACPAPEKETATESANPIVKRLPTVGKVAVSALAAITLLRLVTGSKQ